jgi:lysophospholipase L1-like esterase
MHIFKTVLSFTVSAVLAVSAVMFSVSAAENQPSFVVLGDSIASGYGLGSASDSYAAIVAKQCGYALTNEAVSGHNTSDLLKLLNGDDSVIAAVGSADIIDISIGGNDFRPLLESASSMAADIASGDFSQADAVLSRTKNNFIGIIDRIRTLNSDVTVIVHTLYNPDFSSSRESVGQLVGRLNQIFTDCLSDRAEAYVISDICSAFGDTEAFISDDKLHPSEAGHVKIAQTLLDTIGSLKLEFDTPDGESENEKAVAAVVSQPDKAPSSEPESAADDEKSESQSDAAASLGALPFILAGIALLAAASIIAAVVISRQKPAQASRQTQGAVRTNRQISGADRPVSRAEAPDAYGGRLSSGTDRPVSVDRTSGNGGMMDNDFILRDNDNDKK